MFTDRDNNIHGKVYETKNPCSFIFITKVSNELIFCLNCELALTNTFKCDQNACGYRNEII